MIRKEWAQCCLLDVAEPRGEKVVPAECPGMPFIGMDHVETDTMQIVGCGAADDMKSHCSRFYASDIIYGRLRPYLNKVAVPEFDGVASAEFIVLPPNDAVASKFLALRLNAQDFVAFAAQLNEGDRPRVNFKQIGGFPLHLPPMVEQLAIVEKIEMLFSELDKGVEQLQAVREQLKRYRQAVLKAAFEGRLTAEWREQQKDLPAADELLEQIRAEREARYQQQLEEWEQAVAAWEAAGGKESGQKKPRKPSKPKNLPPLTDEELAELPDLPERWKWVRLTNLASDMCLGKMLDKKKNKGTLTPYLRNINVRWLHFDMSDLLEMRCEPGDDLKHGVRDGDLVVCEGGEPGRCAVWRGQGRAMMIQKALHRVRLAESFDSDYAANFMYYAASVYHLDQFLTGTTIKHLTGVGLEKVTFPVCSNDEQRQITNEIESRFSVLDELEQAVETGLGQAEALRQSILKQAFEGRLLSDAELAAVRADPDYEPADRLLERIRAEREPAAATPKPTRRVRLPRGERYRQAAFAAYAVSRLADRSTFGRTQMMKYLYLVPHLLEVESHIHPRREAAGPWDPAIYKIEGLGKKQGWFGVRKSGQRYTYRWGTSIDDGCNAAVENMGPGRVRVDWLLEEFARWDTQQAELLATTLAVWNDHLIEGRKATQKQIIEGVHDWHPDKAQKFSATRIRDCIKWMKDHNLIPQGIGPKSEPVGSAT